MKRILIFFILIQLSVFFVTGCASTGKGGSSENIEPVIGENIVVKSYSLKACYKDKPATIIKKPAEYKTDTAETIASGDDNITVYLYAKKFAQGNAGYAEITYKNDSSIELTRLAFNEREIPLTKTSWGWRGFFAIGPQEKTGLLPLIAAYTSAGVEKHFESKINVRKVNFPISKKLLDLGKFSDPAYTKKPEFREFIKECESIRKKAFSIVSDDCMTNELCHPRNMHKITGDYWKKRIYADYKKKGRKKVRVPGHTSFHRGVDLKGESGAPVFAMAAGRVVLSHKMFYEGNMVVLDHGNQVFTYYMHMSKLEVKDGDEVKAGTLIGRVGSTGTSTAPHLHVALSIRGVHVDPLSLLALPVGK